MFGAIAGDIIGSLYERNNLKSKKFPLFSPGAGFTDDTVCTLAVADCLIHEGDFASYLRQYVRRHPNRGYGQKFRHWAFSHEGPYNSWGNGSAMRVSPVAHFARDEKELLDLAEQSASVSHNHPDAIAGAQAVALAIWMAKLGEEIEVIRKEVSNRFRYDLTRTVDEIRPNYSFDVSCAGSVPEAITCALEASDFEDAIRNAVSIGGDSDTIACIAGAIAECLFDKPRDIVERVEGYLSAPNTEDLLDTWHRFNGFKRA